MSINRLFSRLVLLVSILVLNLCLALPALAHEGGDGGGEGTGGGGGGGSAAEATQAAGDARDAAEAAEQAASSVGTGVGAAPGAMQLNSPGSGVTAGPGGASSGVSAMDRAALDAITVNRNSWSPF